MIKSTNLVINQEERRRQEMVELQQEMGIQVIFGKLVKLCWTHVSCQSLCTVLGMLESFILHRWVISSNTGSSQGMGCNSFCRHSRWLPQRCRKLMGRWNFFSEIFRCLQQCRESSTPTLQLILWLHQSRVIVQMRRCFIRWPGSLF